MSFSFRRISITSFLFIFFLQSAVCQSQEKLYSLMIVNFARGIMWPDPGEAFTVGVIGYPPLVSELENTSANTSIHGKKIRVKLISGADEVQGCQIVFIPAYKIRLLSEVLSRIPSDPTLIVTNRTDMARQGSCVDLVLRNGKLTYEINCKVVESRGLKVSKAIRNGGTVIGL